MAWSAVGTWQNPKTRTSVKTGFEPPDWWALVRRVEDVREDFRNRVYGAATTEADEVVVDVETDEDFTKRGSTEPPVEIPAPLDRLNDARSGRRRRPSR